MGLHSCLQHPAIDIEGSIDSRRGEAKRKRTAHVNLWFAAYDK